MGGILVALLGNVAWEKFSEPALAMGLAVGSVEWTSRHEPPEGITEVRLWDTNSQKLLATGRVTAPDSTLNLTDPQYGFVVKFVLMNTGRSPATDIKIPFFFNYGGTARVFSTPNISAHLEDEPSSQSGSGLKLIEVPALPPRTKAVVTYEFEYDSTSFTASVVPPQPLMKLPFVVSRETGTSQEIQLIPLTDAIGEELVLNPAGTPFVSVRWNDTGKPGPAYRRMELQGVDPAMKALMVPQRPDN